MIMLVKILKKLVKILKKLVKILKELLKHYVTLVVDIGKNLEKIGKKNLKKLVKSGNLSKKWPGIDPVLILSASY